ncbi:MAG: hypothetical protein Q7V05_04915 [Methanoregula sp.]|nr:hypothetical protein [Methanoregula sp.]
MPADTCVAAQEPVLEGECGRDVAGFFSAVPCAYLVRVRLLHIRTAQCAMVWMMEWGSCYHA